MEDVKNNSSYDYSATINTDAWNTFMKGICINDNVETLLIHYKGITYKLNLEKVLNLLADVVEDIAVVNK